MQEIWKDINGYEGYYQVSNYGRVKSFDTIVPSGTKNHIMHQRIRKGKFLKQFDNGRGYLKVTLGYNGRKSFFVHKLVATAFIPNPNNYIEVNHIDENKYNNIVSNLEWCDRKYNCNYGTRNLRLSETKRKLNTESN